MAVPPEPIEELLPSVVVLFDGEVVEVLHSDEPMPDPPHLPGAAGVGRKAPRQVVRLQANEVLRGELEPGATVEVIKPPAGYALRVGNHGPFLLDGADPPVILGRYGPDSYALEALRAALKG